MALPRYSMEDAILADDAKPTRQSNGIGAVSFEVKVFFSTMCLLSWPLSICYFMYQKPSVSYWFGNWEIILGAGIGIWLIAMYVLMAMKFLGKGTAMVALLIVPSTVLAVSCELQELQFRFISGALQSQDCSFNTAKVNIQQAWEVAYNTSLTCDKYLMKATGSSIQEVEAVRRFENCPGYYDAMGKYKKEWSYLAALEKDYQCGGWCTPGFPLWARSTTPLDSCALAAGHAMDSSIENMGKQVSIFSLILLISVSLWQLLLPKQLRGDDE